MHPLNCVTVQSLRTSRQRGASLIIVMLILIVVSILGIGAAQISMMGERSARNDRDMQVAWQAAEAALVDAEFDIRGPNTSGSSRIETIFGGKAQNSARPLLSEFDVTACGTGGTNRGLCAFVDESLGATQQQKWLVANFTVEGNGANTARYGEFTGRPDYPAGGIGVQSVKVPRYVIEPIRDYGGFLESRSKSDPAAFRYMYRVTSMGFGPRDDIQAVAQMILRP